MKDIALLRTASVLTLIHSVLHTAGGLLRAPAHGAKEIAVLSSMKGIEFDFMGSMRSYWDFYVGFGLFVTLGLVLQAVLLWQLAPLARQSPDVARPLLLTLLVSFIATMAVAWRYFFIAPFLNELLIAVLVAIAYIRTRLDHSGRERRGLAGTSGG